MMDGRGRGDLNSCRPYPTSYSPYTQFIPPTCALKNLPTVQPTGIQPRLTTRVPKGFTPPAPDEVRSENK